MTCKYIQYKEAVSSLLALVTWHTVTCQLAVTGSMWKVRTSSHCGQNVPICSSPTSAVACSDWHSRWLCDYNLFQVFSECLQRYSVLKCPMGRYSKHFHYPVGGGRLCIVNGTLVHDFRHTAFGWTWTFRHLSAHCAPKAVRSPFRLTAHKNIRKYLCQQWIHSSKQYLKMTPRVIRWLAVYPVFNKSNPMIELLGWCFYFSKQFLYLAHDVHIISSSLLPAMFFQGQWHLQYFVQYSHIYTITYRIKHVTVKPF